MLFPSHDPWGNLSLLPAPDIADGSDYFGADLWTGNDATRDITVADSQGNTWAPDLVWIKMRNSTMSHYLYDTVRGAAESISSDSTRAETTDVGRLTAFNTDGFELGSSSRVNSSPNTYVGWSWLAGGSTSSNTNGSITSTVSVNASAGFSIVSYTGVAGDNISATVGHGLGVAPDVVIIKNRDWASSGAAWQTYHSALPSTGSSPVRLGQSLSLDTSDAASGNDFKDQMNNTLPTSTVFSVSSHDGVSAANRYRTYGRADDYIAYCFAEVEGYSKFGSYTGNGSTDGPFVYCGFKPAFVLTKDTTGHNWEILDSARDDYNVAEKRLFPSNNSSESTTETCHDFVSNGFKVRGDHGGNNVNGSLHIFMAFAEHPFGGDGVSPATAR